MRTQQLMTVACFLAVIIAAGCKKNDKAQPGEADAQQSMKTIGAKLAANGGMTVLGDRLINPYKVELMEQAKKKLEARGIRAGNAFTVRETHLYVKFKPKSEEEFRMLCDDKNLDLYDFPLDYDIAVLGNYYREPGLDDNTPTPQYAVVPVDFRFNEHIGYEIADRLYVPEKDEQLMGAALNEDYRYLGALLNETYGVNPPTDRFPRWDLQPAETGANDGFSGGGPDGFIRVFDTRLNRMIPLEWVDVRVLNGMTTYHGTTDNTGQYWLDNWFSGSSIVKVHLQKQEFVINSFPLTVAEIVRQGNGTYCDVTINDAKERFYATMFRAANRYYYGNVGGLTRPVKPIYAQSLLGVNGVGSASGINYIVFPQLSVWRYGPVNGVVREYGTDEIFSTTIHELAHSAHVKTMNVGSLQYAQLNNIIRESWPTAVEWFITGMEYREKGVVSTSATTFNYGDWNYNPSNPPQFPNQQAFQYWRKADDPEYTSLFINIVDNVNDATVFAGRPIDNLTGYTLTNIQSSFLKHVYGLSSLRTQLKANKPPGVTDAQIDQLISAYE